MEENIKINFFKKIWYSIAKPSKYEEFRKQGVGKAVKYFFSIVCILALIVAIIATFIQLGVVKEAINYLDEKLPEIKFKENILSLENEEATILDDEKIIEYFRNVIVINPLLGKQEAIDQYKDLATDKNNVIVFLNDEYVLISNKYTPENENEEGIVSQKYTEISSNFIKDLSYEYGKKDVIEYLKQRTSFTYYIAQYFVVYFGMITLLYVIYISLTSVALWLVTKISKNKWNYKESLMNTIYASTLSMFIYVAYMIIGYFTKLRISFMDIISIALIFVYLYLILWKQKKQIKEDKNKS